MTDYLQQFVDSLELDTEPVAPVEEPSYLAGWKRGVKVIEPPKRAQIKPMSLAEARALIEYEMDEYAALVNPPHMLLVKAQPGVGKTHSGVRRAEKNAAQGRRTLFLAPRHDFIHDLRAIADNRLMIYEWLPRQAGNEYKEETCRHTEQISTWLHRGYEAIDFCKGVCGWDYIGKCPYHAQKNRTEPIVMGQHAHLTSGHPLDFDFVIGDESPMSSMLFQWLIPSRWILPPNMDLTEPIAGILHEFTKLAENNMALSGPALIKVLGGAGHVLDSCRSFVLPATAVAIAPDVHVAGDADKAPFFHLPHLLPLLQREAEAAAAGREYPHRIIVENGNLMLLLRKSISPKMPAHVIWLDATGNEHLYREMFDRPIKVVDPVVEMRGRIIQVADRANGKATLIQDGAPTDKATQLDKQVAQIISRNELKNPGIVSFQALEARFVDMRFLNFYGARGTNVAQDVDGLIVAGTPQPSLFELERQARMVFFDRMMPFDVKWTLKDIAYDYIASDGQGRAYNASGFWHDADLEAVLWQYREAELIQAIHRSRLTVRDVTVWLLSNLPLTDLPVSELISIAELMGAPAGVDLYLWQRFVELAETTGSITSTEAARDLSIDRDTARKYVDLLKTMPGWTDGAVKIKRGRGQPPKMAMKAE